MRSFKDIYINKNTLGVSISTVGLPYFENGNLLYEDIKLFLQEKNFSLKKEIENNTFNSFIYELFFTTTIMFYSKFDIFLKYIRTDLDLTLHNINYNVFLFEDKFITKKRINYVQNRSKFTGRMLKELQFSYISLGINCFSKRQVISVGRLLQYYKKHTNLIHEDNIVLSSKDFYNIYNNTLDNYKGNKKHQQRLVVIPNYQKNIKNEKNYNNIILFLRECFVYTLCNGILLHNKKSVLEGLLDNTNILDIMRVFNTPIEETIFLNSLDCYYYTMDNKVFKKRASSFIMFEYLTGNLFVYKNLEYLKTVQKEHLYNRYKIHNVFLGNFFFNIYSIFKYLYSNENSNDVLNIYLSKDFLVEDLYVYESIFYTLHKQKEIIRNNFFILLPSNLNIKLIPLYTDEVVLVNNILYEYTQQIETNVQKFIRCL